MGRKGLSKYHKIYRRRSRSGYIQLVINGYPIGDSVSKRIPKYYVTVVLSQFVKDQSKNWACMICIYHLGNDYQGFSVVNFVLIKSVIVNQVYKMKINLHGIEVSYIPFHLHDMRVITRGHGFTLVLGQ